MGYYLWIHGRKGASELFWTGTNWTTVLQFGKTYSFNDAIAIMEKRFHDKYPKPLIKSQGYFLARLRAERKKKKKDCEPDHTKYGR